jgi:hypothetical protein
MLCAYISGLKAYHKQSKRSREMEGLGWDEALKSAENALIALRKAESHCHNGDLDSADASVQEGLCALQKRYYFQSSSCSIVFLTLSQFRSCTINIQNQPHHD